MQIEEQVKEGQKKEVPAIRPPEGCYVCWGKKKDHDEKGFCYGIYTSVPVYLVDGKKYIHVCYIARCVNCGHIRSYGIQQGIYKLNGNKADFGISYWPEIQKYRVDVDKFLNKIFHSQKGPVYVDLHEVSYGRYKYMPAEA